jgi:hypothetical protein
MPEVLEEVRIHRRPGARQHLEQGAAQEEGGGLP